ncbi:MAG: type II toxin-antitoxin system VapC family toxin [Chloroflexi bacterium]|nr:type II toxin-antitoxin system VapC family toxin [Chloroflexota bacterium]
MARPRFVDSNVLLRYLTGSDADKAERAKQLLHRIERGAEKAATSLMVVFETVFTLQRTYQVPKAQIREMVADLLSLPGLLLPGKSLCLQALDLYVEMNISFVDAFNAVYMKSRGLSEIYSWDSDFDRIEGVKRLVPEKDTPQTPP